MRSGVRELALRPPGNLQKQGAKASPKGNDEAQDGNSNQASLWEVF